MIEKLPYIAHRIAQNSNQFDMGYGVNSILINIMKMVQF